MSTCHCGEPTKCYRVKMCLLCFLTHQTEKSAPNPPEYYEWLKDVTPISTDGIRAFHELEICHREGKPEDERTVTVAMRSLALAKASLKRVKRQHLLRRNKR